jgi:hypothetical protein
MLSKFLQVTKAVSYVVTLMLILQLSGLGCALGCAKAATVTSQHECHDSDSKSAPATPVVSASVSAEHACCHSSTSARSETLPSELVRMAETMPCCLLASQIAVVAVKQSATIEKTTTLVKEKVPASLNIEFRAMPLAGRARLPDRGGTFLRCCVLLI